MESYQNQPLFAQLDQSIQYIQEVAQSTSDLLVNRFLLSGIPAALLCCEGMHSTATITELILRPITQVQLEHPTAQNLLQYIEMRQLYSTDRAQAETYGELFRFLNSGFAVLLIDGAAKALTFGVQGYDKRGVWLER